MREGSESGFGIRISILIVFLYDTHNAAVSHVNFNHHHNPLSLRHQRYNSQSTSDKPLYPTVGGGRGFLGWGSNLTGNFISL
jgi:hypothetical protein